MKSQTMSHAIKARAKMHAKRRALRVTGFPKGRAYGQRFVDTTQGLMLANEFKRRRRQLRAKERQTTINHRRVAKLKERQLWL